MLTNLAACARVLNERYLASFAQSYGPLIAATAGNGEDLTYAFHTRRLGGKVFPHGRCQTMSCGLQTRQYSQLDTGTAEAGSSLHRRPSHLKARA